MIYYKLKYKITSGYYKNEVTHLYEVKTDKIWYSQEELIEFLEYLTLWKIIFFNKVFEIEIIIDIKNNYEIFTYNIIKFLKYNIKELI